MQENTSQIDFNSALMEIDTLWTLKTVAESDTHWFKLIKFEGDFEWHQHEEDKLLMVLEGKMHIDFHDRDTVSLTKGDTAIVPKNTLHKPVADGICGIMLIEKK